jgi:hypothetical protein
LGDCLLRAFFENTNISHIIGQLFLIRLGGDQTLSKVV